MYDQTAGFQLNVIKSGKGLTFNTVETAKKMGRGESELDSETASGRSSAAEEDAAADVQNHLIRWAVPLSQFQLDPQLFRPKPPLHSKLMTTSTGLLSLDWQLSLIQFRTEAKLELVYKTAGIPNQGVQYTTYAEKADGSGRVRLTSFLRQSLAAEDGKGGVKAAYGRRVVFPDASVHLEVHVRLSAALWHPRRLVDKLMETERAQADDYADGTVGLRLWEQVKRGTEAAEPAEADVCFVCPRGQRVFAHKAVIAAFSPRFKASISGGAARRGRWTVNCEQISAQALWEVLHFVYLRKAAPSLYKASLSQVLEAARLFRQPKLLSLEVEKLLLMCVDEGNAERMWTLANVYSLDVLANAVLTRTAAPDALRRLHVIRSKLRANGELPSAAPIPA